MTKPEPLRFPVPAGPPPPEPPGHLSEPMLAWWRSLCDRYVFAEHHLEVLRLACEAWDIAQESRAQVAEDGVTILDRFGQQKEHPAASVWRHNAALFQRLVRELQLDKLSDTPRPPRLY